tara:strand:+ start:121 stop:615 length:495 start_codon:yes stop_codon:yes gene_type:complete
MPQSEYQREWYLKNKERLLQKAKQYGIDNKQKKKDYEQSPQGIKTRMIWRWRNEWGIKGDLEKIYEKYINTANCEVCNIELTMDKKITNTRKCLDHNHTTNEFRNIVCHSCNCKIKMDYKNNTSGHKYIYYVKSKDHYVCKSKTIKARYFKKIEDAIDYKNSFD